MIEGVKATTAAQGVFQINKYHACAPPHFGIGAPEGKHLTPCHGIVAEAGAGIGSVDCWMWPQVAVLTCSGFFDGIAMSIIGEDIAEPQFLSCR